MPINKLAAFRYRVIDRMLGSARGSTVSSNELIEEISRQLEAHGTGSKSRISLRTLRYDIETMRSRPPAGYGAPIEAGRYGYCYTDPGYSILNQPISDHDREKLEQALELVRQYRGMFNFGEVDSFIDQLYYRVLYSADRDREIINFEKNPRYLGMDHLPGLYRAIAERRTVYLTYKPFTMDALRHVVHPYMLKEYNNRWYLLAMEHASRKLNHYALDRIKRIGDGRPDYIPNTEISADTYFRDVVGVSIPVGRVRAKVQIWCTAERAPYIKTKPLHLSQKLESESPQGSIFSYELVPNKELVAELLAFGPDVIVLSPDSLAREMKALHDQAGRQYGQNTP